MKLKRYMKDLNKLIKDYPDSLGYEVVTSIDDEGNAFIPVVYNPSPASIGLFEDGEFTPDVIGSNAVCLN